MSEAAGRSAASAGASAGALLREARLAQGMHIAALAAAIKVTPRKLEALEADRYDELPDATFVRALAQAVCRVLKLDPAPVLARLPQAASADLDSTIGLNRPFRPRTARREGRHWPSVSTPALWGAVILLVAAAVVYVVPPAAWRLPPWIRPDNRTVPASVQPTTSTVTETILPAGSAVTSDPNAAPASGPGTAGQVLGTSPAAAPASGVSAGAQLPVTAAAPGTPASAAAGEAAGLTVQARATSWVEVRAADGQVLIARTLKPAEAVTVEGPVPLRVTIGNAAAIDLSFRGKPVPLNAGRENIAHLELK
ncbi:MAG TPA: helix-turn-helix domain-containing protein [Burkholderiaceae bacterium]|nr:helix-turn-helix domain-containing protein [Burkholderiaceae bacterium]